MKKHVNIPVFIPHWGCPNACVFCNQKKITGKPCYQKENVTEEIENALKTVNTSVTETEIAFFGGSFTAIPENEMLGLLEISDFFIKSGRVSSVRLSTRPDAINEKILDILKEHGVKTIELGLQSFSDRVLSNSKRGHSAKTSEDACKLIKSYGFDLIGQMMVGLPSSSLSDELLTAEKICSLGCDGARIYPTVVFPETELCRMKDEGKYTPLTIEEAIERTSEIFGVFVKHDVPVIRIGLCSNETLSDASYEENYHPSVGELAKSRYFLKKADALLSDKTDIKGKNVKIYVSVGKISQAIGQKKTNKEILKSKYGLKDLKVSEKADLHDYETELDIE